MMTYRSASRARDDALSFPYHKGCTKLCEAMVNAPVKVLIHSVRNYSESEGYCSHRVLDCHTCRRFHIFGGTILHPSQTLKITIIIIIKARVSRKAKVKSPCLINWAPHHKTYGGGAITLPFVAQSLERLVTDWTTDGLEFDPRRLNSFQSHSYFAIDSLSISTSWCRAQSGTCDQMLFSFRRLMSEFCCPVFCWAPSLTRGRVCYLTVFISSYRSYLLLNPLIPLSNRRRVLFPRS
jgi:hypothetical protein